MRLVATLLVRDEADVVAATIEHHLAQGVDLVIATDNGSVDGTRDILAAYAGAGVVEVIDEPDHTYRQAEWVTRMARRAAELGADWVVNLDADEFWVPVDRARTLRDVLAEVPDGYDTLLARRTDLVGVRGTWGPWPRRLRWRNLATVSERGTPLAPKICHRAVADVDVAQGNHAVAGLRGERVPDEPIDVLHVPLRSWPQFERKIANGGSSYAANTELATEIGWHWRADYERLLAGEARARLPLARAVAGGPRHGPAGRHAAAGLVAAASAPAPAPHRRAARPAVGRAGRRARRGGLSGSPALRSRATDDRSCASTSVRVSDRAGRTWPRSRPCAGATTLRSPRTTRWSRRDRPGSSGTAASSPAPCGASRSRSRNACRGRDGR